MQPIRCPRCRGDNTSPEHRTPDGATAFACQDCGLSAAYPKHDPAPAWETLLDRRDAFFCSTLEDFEMRFGLERWARERDEELADVAAACSRPLEIDDVRAIFASAVGRNPSAVEVEVVGALALLLWGRRPKLGKSWYRKNPRRSPFGNLGDALRCTAGALGVGAVHFEIAETRTDRTLLSVLGDPEDGHRLALGGRMIRRHARSLRTGIVHCKGSQNGSTGGTKNLVRLGLQADVERCIAASGVDPEEVQLLRVAFGEGRSRPDYAEAADAFVRWRQLVPWNASPTDRQKSIDAEKPRLAKALGRAAKAIAKELRRPPRKVLPDGSQYDPDEVPLLAPERDDVAEEGAATASEEAPRPMPVRLNFGFRVAS